MTGLKIVFSESEPAVWQIIFCPKLPVSDMNIFDQDLNINLQDTVRQKTDTTHLQIKLPADSSDIIDTVPVKKVVLRQTKERPVSVDVTAVSKRNPYSDFTFSDSTKLKLYSGHEGNSLFPFSLIEKNRTKESSELAALMKDLRDGKKMPVQPFHDDWIIFILLLCAFLFSLIRTFSKRFLTEVTRFFFFRGIGDSSARDIAALFHWYSTLTNLISFLGLALFAYCTGLYYSLIPDWMSGFVFWAISFGIIILSVTVRHILCFLTGRISGQVDLFNEYIITIYHSYRFSALFLFFIVILISYTRILNPKVLFITGFLVFAGMYLIRIIRLFFIFLKRNFSILYLILYLCALEFLPVLIILKYFTGLF
jgi:hypothetical protein